MKTGQVTYFDLWRGFGFIEPADGNGPDAWVHVTAMEGFPDNHLPYLAIGEVVEYESEPGEPAEDGRPRERASVVRPPVGRLQGTVVDYGFHEGHGVIEASTGERYFMHHSEMYGSGMKSADPGDAVTFEAAGESSGVGDRMDKALAVKLGDPRPRLHRFGQFPRRDLREWLEPLASAAEKEDWDYHHELAGRGGYKPVLRDYLERTFVRLEEEQRRQTERGHQSTKIVETTDSDGEPVALFNTGLVTEDQQPIYALFGENRSEDAYSPWWWRGFYPQEHRCLSDITELPEPADYLSEVPGGEGEAKRGVASLFIRPDEVETMRVDYDHIVRDHLDLFPEHLRDNSRTAKLVLQGDLDNMPDRIRRNYKAAVPQLYRGEIQLLLPLDLGGEGARQDLALVCEWTGSGYRASTVLGVDLAYSQSRLIARPDPEWLGQAWLEHRLDSEPTRRDREEVRA